MDASNGVPDHCARRGRPTNAKAMSLLLQSEDDAAARCTPPSPPKPTNPPSRCRTGTRRGYPRQRAALPAARRPRQSLRAASSGSSSRSPRIGASKCSRRSRSSSSVHCCSSSQAGDSRRRSVRAPTPARSSPLCHGVGRSEVSGCTRWPVSQTAGGGAGPDGCSAVGLARRLGVSHDEDTHPPGGSWSPASRRGSAASWPAICSPLVRTWWWRAGRAAPGRGGGGASGADRGAV